MSSPSPTRTQGDLAEMLETLLDKGVLVNADVAVTVGDTELLGIRIQAAIASFATAAEYGMEFPTGTDMDRVQEAAGLDSLDSTASDNGAEPVASDGAPERGETMSSTAEDAVEHVRRSRQGSEADASKQDVSDSAEGG